MWMSTSLFRSRVEGTEEVHVTSQRFNAKKPKAPNAAASGKVVIQAKRIPTIMFQWRTVQKLDRRQIILKGGHLKRPTAWLI